MVKTACIIHYWGEQFNALGACAVRSFKKFNPEVDVYHGSLPDFECIKNSDIVESGKRLLVAQELMKEQGYEKVIILGADTITCARLDEFLDNGEDILATWDYDGPLTTSRFQSLPHQPHLNADVVCFNNVKAIEKILEVLPHYSKPNWDSEVELYYEQGALNEVFYIPNGISGRWVEGTPPAEAFFTGDREIEANPLYNVKAKSTIFYDETDEYGNQYWKYVVGESVGNISVYTKSMVESRSDLGGFNCAMSQLPSSWSLRGEIPDSFPKYEEVPIKGTRHTFEASSSPWKPFVSKFYSENGKLFVGDDRQIKVWHYCDGFGNMVDLDHELKVWKNEWFNSDTKKFFIEHCDCGDFFEKELS